MKGILTGIIIDMAYKRTRNISEEELFEEMEKQELPFKWRDMVIASLEANQERINLMYDWFINNSGKEYDTADLYQAISGIRKQVPSPQVVGNSSIWAVFDPEQEGSFEEYREEIRKLLTVRFSASEADELLKAYDDQLEVLYRDKVLPAGALHLIVAGYREGFSFHGQQ